MSSSKEKLNVEFYVSFFLFQLPASLPNFKILVNIDCQLKTSSLKKSFRLNWNLKNSKFLLDSNLKNQTLKLELGLAKWAELELE